MQLVREQQPDGKPNKYAVINLMKIAGPVDSVEKLIAAIQANHSLVEWGRPGEKDEHFVVKMKDENAEGAMEGYSRDAMRNGDDELAEATHQIALRSGRNSPFCKVPD